MARRISSLTPRSARMGSPLSGWSGRSGMDLPIEIVQEGNHGPQGLVPATLRGVGEHAGFNGQGVPAEVLVLGELAQNLPSLISVHSLVL